MSRNLERVDLNHEAFDDLAAAFALDALDDLEAARFRRHLAGCGRCQELVADYRAVAGILPETLPERDASPDLRQRVLDAACADLSAGTVARRATTSRPRRRLPLWLLPVAALLVLTTVSGLWGFRLRADLDQQTRVVRLQERALSALAAGAPTRNLSGTDQAPQAGGILIQSPDEPQTLVVVRNLPALPAGRAYQVWAISGSTPAGAGLLSPAPDGVQVAQLDRYVNAADTVALTVEPAGGSPAPTGPIVLTGKA